MEMNLTPESIMAETVNFSLFPKDILPENCKDLLPLHFVSYSSLNLFHLCPRKLELQKMGAGGIEVTSRDLAFGSAVGAGVQELLISGDRNKAWLAAFIAWNLPLLDGIG